jgi:hypothetical protein
MARAWPVFILFFPCLQDTKHPQSQQRHKSKANFDEKIQPTPAAGNCLKSWIKQFPIRRMFRQGIKNDF